MTKENPLHNLLSQLNRQYNLSEDFKTRVTQLVERIEGLNLLPEQLEALAGKVKETYERQVIVESSREESRKSLEKIQSVITNYSTALSSINQRLDHAETALENLLNSNPSSEIKAEKGILPFDRERAKALTAFANINSKNSRVH